MSRTKKGSKGCGYDFWGRRAKSCCPPGKVTKQITKRIERARSKAAVRKGEDLPLREAF